MVKDLLTYFCAAIVGHYIFEQLWWKTLVYLAKLRSKNQIWLIIKTEKFHTLAQVEMDCLSCGYKLYSVYYMTNLFTFSRFRAIYLKPRYDENNLS